MSLLYSFSIRLLVVAIYVAQWFNPKAAKWIAGRKNFWSSLPEMNKTLKVVWFHCASLGEFDQGLPLMNRIKEEDPSVFLLVSFFSPSGFENYHKRKHCIDFACYLPADTPQNARKFVDYFNPAQCFFVKYEFWCNYILAAKKSGSSVYSVCAIFRPNHRFFKWYGSFFRYTLRQMNHFFVQNQQSIDLLHSIGIQECTIVGDMRFDRVIENKKQVSKDEVVELFLGGQKAFIVGSSWPVDEDFLQDTILTYSKEHKVIIAPHQIGESHLLEIEKRFGENIIRYAAVQENKTLPNILLIDSIGKLANLYQYGFFAYIGGGFTGSLHNILEPGVFGLPVIFGPKHSRFPEGELFIGKGVGFSLSDASQLENTIRFIEDKHDDLRQKLEVLVLEQSGAAGKIFAKLEGELKIEN